jgi:NitT/TauT family transport system substrate-binding protein
MFVKANPSYTRRIFWDTLYGTYPVDANRGPERLTFTFTITPAVLKIIEKDVTFLRSFKAIDTDKLRPEAVMPEFADQILKERGLKSPVGVVRALPKNPY